MKHTKRIHSKNPSPSWYRGRKVTKELGKLFENKVLKT
jgi:hypothetical protein